MNRRGCSRDILAESSIGSIERCSCGCVHLTLGPLSLRLDEAAIVGLAAMITRAVATLENRRGVPIPVPATTLTRGRA